MNLINFKKLLKELFIFLSFWILGIFIIFYTVMLPPKDTDVKNFRICIIKNGAIESMYLENFNTSSLYNKLCQEPSKKTDYKENLYSLKIDVIKDNNQFKTIKMTEMTDGLGDPNIYKYRINQNTNQISPLWQQHGENFSWFLSIVTSFIFYILLIKGLNFYKKRVKTK